MTTEDDGFLVRARQLDRLIAKPALFGSAMIELVATEPVPLSEAIAAVAKRLLECQAPPFTATDEAVVRPLAVPEVENG